MAVPPTIDCGGSPAAMSLVADHDDDLSSRSRSRGASRICAARECRPHGSRDVETHLITHGEAWRIVTRAVLVIRRRTVLVRDLEITYIALGQDADLLVCAAVPAGRSIPRAFCPQLIATT